jgi:hypothetical protein
MHQNNSLSWGFGFSTKNYLATQATAEKIDLQLNRDLNKFLIGCRGGGFRKKHPQWTKLLSLVLYGGDGGRSCSPNGVLWTKVGHLRVKVPRTSLGRS